MNRAPRLSRASFDALLAAAVLVVEIALGLSAVGSGRRPDALGWTLLAVAVVLLAWRRRSPMLVLAGIFAAVVPYHAMDYSHAAPVPAGGFRVTAVLPLGRPEGSDRPQGSDRPDRSQRPGRPDRLERTP